MQLMGKKPHQSDADEFTTAAGYARSAINLMSELRIPPNPSRFTVAYIHQTGENTDLSMAMNRLLGHDKLNSQAMDELFSQFFGRTVEEAELRDASQRIERTVTEVADCIGAASHSAERYGGVLAEFAEGEPAGDFNEKISTILDETRHMAAANRQFEERLQFSSTEIEILRKNLERLEREASLDSLTGIANRKRFDQVLRECMARVNSDSSPLTLLMMDIDHFKNFNDSHGHLVGDQVLKLVARYVTDSLRPQDTAARYGGEEFVVILPHTDIRDALRVAETVRHSVASKKVVNRRTGINLGQVTLSVGAALYRRGETAAELVHRADEALYRAKAGGRNRVVSESELPEGG